MQRPGNYCRVRSWPIVLAGVLQDSWRAVYMVMAQVSLVVVIPRTTRRICRRNADYRAKYVGTECKIGRAVAACIAILLGFAGIGCCQ
jgi:hypothetical protein